MTATMHRPVGIYFATILVGLTFHADRIQAEITYLDAVSGPSGNTFATGGSASDTSWINPDSGTDADDDQWKVRTLGNDATILQALHTGTSIPELTTEISGLADDTYEVWVFFWDGPNSNQWTISAGLAPGSLTTYSFDGPGNTSAAVSASALNFTNAITPMTTEDPRIMYGVNLGQATVSGGSPIKVYIDNLAGGGSDNRTWYDGVGYQPADTTAQPSYTPLLGVDFNRSDALASPSQSKLRIVAGSAASQQANASSYTKSIGTGQVTVSQPNGTKLEFRGANNDSSRAIPGGDTSLSFLISDFIATREGAIDLQISGLAAGDYLFRSWHLDTFIRSGLGFAQGTTSNSPNTIEARIDGALKDSVQPTVLGADGLNTTFLNNTQIPTLEFAITHDGTTPLTIELRSTQSNGSENFLLLNGFQLFQTNP